MTPRTDKSIHGAIPVSPEIAIRSQGWSWISSDKDHVTQSHHPSLTSDGGVEPALSSHLQGPA